MRKELLDALKAKFEGVGDAVLGRIADKLAKTATTAEQVKTAAEGVTIQLLARKITLSGDSFAGYVRFLPMQAVLLALRDTRFAETCSNIWADRSCPFS